MLKRYTLPFISALVVSASLASCQRKAEEVTTPAEEIVFTVASASQTKSCAAETSPVAIPVKSDGGEELTLEVSSCPWSVEESSTPATKVAPLGGSYFSTSHNSFGVMTYSVSSLVAPDPTLSWTDEAVYNGSIWTPSSSSRPWPSAGNYLKFFGWAPHGAVTPSDNSGEPVISEFEVEEIAANQVDLLVSKVVSKDSPPSSISVPLTFEHALTAVRFIGVRLTITSVTISGIYDQGSFNMDTGEWFDQSGGQTYSLTSDVTALSSTLMLIPQTLPSGATLTAETSLGTITASLAGQVWKPGKEVTYKITDPVFSFSVSDTQKVRFSPGNLQYQASTGTWRFAAHQWDYVGNYVNGNVYEGGKKCNNSMISHSYSGWIDLFGWGTSGHEFASGYGTAYQPWSNSTDGLDYGPNGNYGLTGDYALGDWGVKNMGSGWRTLTKDEWVWLLGPDSSPDPGTNCRTSSTVNETPNARFAKAYLFGSVHGLIIFPDSYTHPDGVAAPTEINVAGFTTWGWYINQYTEDDWTKMEVAGCVFLPAADQRYNTAVGGDIGLYWSSTSTQNINGAYFISFSSSSVHSADSANPRSRGYSVRLVKDL